jgi:superfamily II DNA or RNA helicase
VINPQFKVITYLANTKKNERSRVKANFTNDPNAKVLVMSMKMGGTGIDFPNAAQHMVINDFDWTPESDEQSEGRIYRINTNHPVNIDYTIANGIDESLFEKVQEKRKIAAIVQKYRKEYHQKDHDPETLNKIIAAQKQLQAIDDEMSNIIANQLPSQQRESFRSFLTNDEAFRKALFTVEA